MTRLRSLLFCAGLLCASPAWATSFSFSCISGDGGGDCAVPADQLWVEVADLGGGEFSLTLHNESTNHAPLSELYIQDGPSLIGSLVAILDGPGVDFELGARPPNLPSGKVEGFDVHWAFSAKNPSPRHGVGPGESVTIVFALVGGTSYADLIAAMQTGALRVGVHAPPFGSGGNKSFVTGVGGPGVPTPEPGSWALLAAAALAGVIARRRS